MGSRSAIRWIVEERNENEHLERKDDVSEVLLLHALLVFS
jgi:hypothetical protein